MTIRSTPEIAPSFATPAGSTLDQAGNVTAGAAGDLKAPGAGHGLQVKAGANAKCGTALLAGGTAVVANTSVTAASLIFLCHKGDGGAVGFLSETKAARVAGVSFTILSSNGADAGHVDFIIVEPL